MPDDADAPRGDDAPVEAGAPDAAAAPGSTGGAPGRWGVTDTWIAAAVVLLPLVVLGIAAATGYPLITGDDAVQNFPLEELSGAVIRHGHLPLWDAFTWSGTPLLGGTVGHALLPITLLFAVLPPLGAWVVGEAMVIGLAATGVQVFLRRTGCSVLASGLGGVSFGLAGFVSSQLVHIDFAAASAALGWALVAVHGLGALPAASRPRHCLLLAAAAAWICLCGSPDIVIDVVVVVGGYLLHLLLQPGAASRRSCGRARLCGWALLGAALGICVGALQWLPSARFVAISERGHPSFSFISGGSLTWANFLELLVPHVLGGGTFGSRAFGGTFPLAEVDAYPGTLALVALFVMASLWRRPDAWRYRVWVCVAGAALLVASGDHTPLEHLVAHLPVVGDQRLPSRALIGFGLACSILLGYFVDVVLSLPLRRRQLVAGAIPLAAVIGVVVATLATGRPAGGALTAHRGTGWTLSGDVGYLVTSVVLALGAAAVLLARGRHGRRTWRFLVAAFVLLDVLVFDANQSSLAPEYSSALSPGDARAVAALTGGGRYLVVDPSLSGALALDSVGAGDVGVVDGLPDAGGYGSLTWAPYASATGTHPQDSASTAAIADGTFSRLGVGCLLTVPAEVVGPPAGAASAPEPQPTPSGRDHWFGRPVQVSNVTLALRGPLPSAPDKVAAVTLLGSGGQPLLVAPPATEVSDSQVAVRFSPPVTALGLATSPDLPPAVPVVQPATGNAFAADGPLAGALSSGGWTEVGNVAGFSAFVNDEAAPLYALRRTEGTVRVVSSDEYSGAATVAVTSSGGGTLVRDVAAVPGWRATVSQGGRARPVVVRAAGLVQSVPVPDGSSTVTFWYDPPGWTAAQGLALAGAVGAGVVLAAPAIAAGARRRRRRRSGSPAAPGLRSG